MEHSADIAGKIQDVEELLDQEIKVELLVEVYKAYLEDTHELRQERLTVDNIRVTVVTLLLGAQAYVASTLLTGQLGSSLRSLTLGSWLPLVLTVAAGLVGIVFCNNWSDLNKDYKKNLAVKYRRLLTLETKKKNLLEPLGADLFTQEDKERKEAKVNAGARGVNERNQALQDFFRIVFVLLMIGMALVKIAGVSLTLLQTYTSLFR